LPTIAQRATGSIVRLAGAASAPKISATQAGVMGKC
jgi:hypothetical protein